MDPWTIVAALAGIVATVSSIAYATQVLRAKDWKDLYLQEAADHAKTLAKAERLVEVLEKRLRESSRPPAMTSGTRIRE